MNPCRCGYFSDPAQACGRAPQCGLDYLANISGPLLDCIDLIVDMPAVKIEDLGAPADGEISALVRERVVAARVRQTARLKTQVLETNADIAGELLDELLPLIKDNRALLGQRAERFKLTARGRLPSPVPRGPHHRRSSGGRGHSPGAFAGSQHLPSLDAGQDLER